MGKVTWPASLAPQMLADRHYISVGGSRPGIGPTPGPEGRPGVADLAESWLTGRWRLL